jgi:uncharacterized Zn finger protein
MGFRDYYGYGDYETAAERAAKAKKQLEKLLKTNPGLCPIIIEGRTIAKSWWGKAWNKNLESYADYSNRIGRGRSYVKNGLVLDLQIEEGIVSALVAGSRSKPYKVKCTIDPLSPEITEKITKLCNRKIESLEDLIEGRFPEELAELFTKSKQGLFPASKELGFSCSCPDYAYMCKHVSAVLYAIGAKLDSDPTLFFKLRGIDFGQFLAKTAEEKMDSMLKNAGQKTGRMLNDYEIAGLFDLT